MICKATQWRHHLHLLGDGDCYLDHAQKAEFIQKVSTEAPQKHRLFLQLHVFRV